MGNTITEREIMLLRDGMELEELQVITNRVKEKQGYVDYRSIFREMGYAHLYGDVWQKPEEIFYSLHGTESGRLTSSGKVTHREITTGEIVIETIKEKVRFSMDSPGHPKRVGVIGLETSRVYEWFDIESEDAERSREIAKEKLAEYAKKYAKNRVRPSDSLKK